jgi:TonB-dependent starch-binding outer membrane protein SusC
MKQRIYWFKHCRQKMIHLLVFLLTFFLYTSVLGQERTITGNVTDQSGAAMIGVNVVVKGTTIGVVTDIDGKYSIKVPDNNAVLAISFIGCITQEFQVGSQTVIDVKLVEEVTQLNEVVVIGYGVQKKSDLTGSVASVSAKDIRSMPITRIDEALEGRAAGVNVIATGGMPGGTGNIQIRGISSINGFNPLVVIDGIPSSTDFNAMNKINPSDIESIEVLKDAASAAIYGASGGNGVILITTRKGQVGKVTTSVNYYTGVQEVEKTLTMMNTRQWNQLYAEMSNGVPYIFSEDSLNRNFDWQKALYRQAKIENIDINVSGGNEKSRFSLGLNYMKQDGIVDRTGYDKLLISIGSVHEITRHIKLDEIIRYSDDKTTGPDEWQYQNVYNNFTVLPALTMLPFQTPYDADGKWTVSPFGGQNPFTGIDERSDQYVKKMELEGNFGLNIEFIKGLVYTTRFDGKTGVREEWKFQPEYFAHAQDNNPMNKLTQKMIRPYSWTYQNYVTYTKSFFEVHNVTLMAGTEASRIWDYDINGWRQDFSNISPNLLYFDNSSDASATGQIISGSGKEKTMASYYGRVNYDFKSILLAQFNYRKDGDSNFGPNNRWGDFYSWSAGLKFSELEPVKNLNILSFGKIRVSWGQVGQFSVKTYYPYASTVLNTYVMNYSFDNKVSSVGKGPVQTPNPDLKWETVVQKNLALDLGFFKDQLMVTVDYFEKTNDEMIMPKKINWVAGTYLYVSPPDVAEVGNTGIKSTYPTINFGSVVNKGLELTMNYKKQVGDLKLNLNVNVTYQTNEITSLASDSTVQGDVHDVKGVTISKVHHSIGEFVGYKSDGLFRDGDPKVYNKLTHDYSFSNQRFKVKANGDTAWMQASAKAGDVKWRDLNNDSILSPKDETYLGSYQAPFIYGFSLGLEYKGFDFNAFFQGVYGNKIFNGLKRFTNTWLGNMNRSAEFANRYHQPIVYNGNTIDPGNTTTNMPAMGSANWGVPSEYFIEDGSYLRLKSITLGYTLPISLTNKVKLQKLRFYVTAKNLFVLTNYSGYDPEVGNQDPLLQGIDVAGYPQTRVYTVGVNLEF